MERDSGPWLVSDVFYLVFVVLHSDNEMIILEKDVFVNEI
jgi:hypothetical protein